MKINNLLDNLVKRHQEECDHMYQDRIENQNGKAYCGKCGKETE